MKLLHSATVRTYRTESGKLISVEESHILGQQPILRFESDSGYTVLEDVPESILSMKEREELGLTANER